MEYFWTYEVDGIIQDHEFNTKSEALEFATEEFSEECQDFEPRNGEEFNREIYLLYISCEDQSIDEREKTQIYYEHYHGDYREHG